jgi:hypothetical protein
MWSGGDNMLPKCTFPPPTRAESGIYGNYARKPHIPKMREIKFSIFLGPEQHEFPTSPLVSHIEPHITTILLIYTELHSYQQ